MPRPLVELGKLTELSYLDGRRRRRVLRWSLARAPSLAYDEGGKLHVVYGARVVARASARDVKEYARTHWGERGAGDERDGGVVKAPFRELGPGVSITYTTRKGSAALVDWVHAWGEGRLGKFVPPQILAHVCQNGRCAGKGRISLRGGTYRVTSRGIVG